MKLVLTRVCEADDSTFGVLTINNKPLFVTCEDRWRNNQRGISCIPKGTYVIKPHQSPNFGYCYKVFDVPDRSDILIHAGNTHKDTRGCVLLGMSFGKLGTDAAVTSSRAALTLFMKEMGDNEGSLEVR